MTRRPCFCPDPDAVDPALCFACGRAERAVPAWPVLKGDVWEEDADGNRMLLPAVGDAVQLELM